MKSFFYRIDMTTQTGSNKIKFLNRGLILNTRKTGLIYLDDNVCVDRNIAFIDMKKGGAFTGCEFDEVSDVAIECAAIGKCSFGERCCILTQFTSSQFQSDDNITVVLAPGFDAIDYNHNGKADHLINFLETSDQKSIRGYDASSCSIFELIRSNFMNLTFLETVNLANNSIMKITPDIFKDLLKLKFLNLGSA